MSNISFVCHHNGGRGEGEREKKGEKFLAGKRVGIFLISKKERVGILTL